MHVLVHLITSESRSNLEEGQREQQGEGKKMVALVAYGPVCMNLND